METKSAREMQGATHKAIELRKACSTSRLLVSDDDEPAMVPDHRSLEEQIKWNAAQQEKYVHGVGRHPRARYNFLIGLGNCSEAESDLHS